MDDAELNFFGYALKKQKELNSMHMGDGSPHMYHNQKLLRERALKIANEKRGGGGVSHPTTSFTPYSPPIDEGGSLDQISITPDMIESIKEFEGEGASILPEYNKNPILQGNPSQIKKPTQHQHTPQSVGISKEDIQGLNTKLDNLEKEVKVLKGLIEALLNDKQ